MSGPSYFEIQSDNPSAAAKFYEEVFGWKAERDPNIPIEYWRLQTGGSMGAILKRPVAVPQGPSGTNAYVCSMEVADFDVSAQKILSLGGIVAMPKFAIPGKCWQGYFLDPDRNTFGLYQPDENAK